MWLPWRQENVCTYRFINRYFRQMSQRRRGQFFGGRALLKASLHELEQATVVNKSGLYAEFKDKEDLFVQSLRYYLESLEKQGLLTAEPLGWNNIERFLKMGPCSLAGQKGCFAVNSIRECAILPPEAVGIM